jgi:hypothetical protein
MMLSGMMLAAHGATMNPVLPQVAGENGAQGQPSLQMVMARAELKNGIDARKAKQGDAIRARLLDKVKLSNGNELGRDTILEGHVDQVQPSENKGDSTVVVTFDKAQVKGGEELPIKATLVKIWEPQESAAGSMSPEGGMPQGGGAPSSGGGSMQSNGKGPGTSDMSRPATSMDVPEAGMPQGTQAVKGVTLHSDIHEKSSATFTSSRKNVDVPSGTQMLFEMVVIPAGVQIQ